MNIYATVVMKPPVPRELSSRDSVVTSLCGTVYCTSTSRQIAMFNWIRRAMSGRPSHKKAPCPTTWGTHAEIFARSQSHLGFVYPPSAPQSSVRFRCQPRGTNCRVPASTCRERAVCQVPSVRNAIFMLSLSSLLLSFGALSSAVIQFVLGHSYYIIPLAP
jgi:hypothetical protein